MTTDKRPHTDQRPHAHTVTDSRERYWSAGQSSGQRLPTDLDQAARFLKFLDPREERFTYQVFPDRDGAPTFVSHGPLFAVADHLVRANEDGAGVFVMIAAGDLQGRKRANVRRMRLVFVDLDGAPLPSPLEHQAHAIVWTSPGRAHLYWRVADVPIDLFRAVQKGLATTFGGDPSVCDPPRVMRLPGFLHQKRDPYRVLPWWLDNDAPPLTLAELRARWPHVDAEVHKALDAAKPRRRTATTSRPTSTPETFPERFQGVFAYKVAKIVGTGRHELLVWGARALLDNGLTEHQARDELLKARDALPARDGQPVPDAEVVDAVAWAFANLTPSGPWPDRGESPQAAESSHGKLRAPATSLTREPDSRKLAHTVPDSAARASIFDAIRGRDGRA